MIYTIKDEKGNIICSIENVDPTKSEEGKLARRMASGIHSIQRNSCIKKYLSFFKMKINSFKNEMSEFVKLGKFTEEAFSKHGGLRFNFEMYVSDYNEVALKELLNKFSESVIDHRLDNTASISNVRINKILKDTDKNKKLFRVTVSIAFDWK